ncbi:ABC transporter ATP-binding protein [Microvirga antarctica]|uniref:ABC transporter ATP-binding protein n=1 Tax=Microvirga antarctica TaxID=2819233 RepID=UPI001B30202F|nr:ABC transporter ATP-binding protein [Microvirga antarctica]
MSLAINDIHFGYGKVPLFRGLGATGLRRGTITAVVGPNGVGKSSLFRLIAGLRLPRRGSLSLDGTDLATLPQRRRHETVFFLSQHVAIRAALTVFDLVLLARKSGRGGRTTPDDLARVETILCELGIDHLSDRHVTDLSGGQQQLVATAQAFVREPQVLLLDEPTSALDLRRQLEVMELVRKVTIARNIVTLVALHDLSLASRFADRFLLLDSGVIVADGSPHEVLDGGAIEDAYGVGIHVERATTGTLMVDAYLRAS